MSTRWIHRGLLLFLLLLIALPAWAAKDFLLAIDIGHTPGNPGAISARGRPEYEFNKQVAGHLLQAINSRQAFSAVIINPKGKEISLRARARAAARAGADLFLSIHHDSAQLHYLKQWTYEGQQRLYTDRFQGHSLFVSKKDPQFRNSLRFAKLLGQQLLDKGLIPTLHHAEKIKGENRPLLDRAKGIYRFDNLVVLKKTRMPAVLLECGVILNPDEELRVSKAGFRSLVADTVIKAVESYRKALVDKADGK